MAIYKIDTKSFTRSAGTNVRIPPGVYSADLKALDVEAKKKAGAEGDNLHAKVQITGPDGDWVGVQLQAWHAAPESSDAGGDAGASFLAQIADSVISAAGGEDSGIGDLADPETGEAEIDTDDLVGKRCFVIVKDEEGKRRDGTPTGRVVSKIAGYCAKARFEAMPGPDKAGASRMVAPTGSGNGTAKSGAQQVAAPDLAAAARGAAAATAEAAPVAKPAAAKPKKSLLAMLGQK